MNISAIISFATGAIFGSVFLFRIFKNGALLKDNKYNRKDNPWIYYFTVFMLILLSVIMLMMLYVELT